MPQSLPLRTPLASILKSLTLGIILIVLVHSTSIGNPLFSFPRDGSFKFASGSMDPWYYLNPNQLEFQSPDKWQHYMGNYLFADQVEKIIGKWPTIILFSSVNILKEVEDGYREGASPKDLGVGIVGMIASLSDSRLICTFDNEKIIFQYSIPLRSIGLEK